MDLQLHRNLLSRRSLANNELGVGELASIKYHSLFGFALTRKELNKWKVSETVASSCKLIDRDGVVFENGFYFLKDNKGAALKRVLGKRFSLQKIKIAKKAMKVLEKIPTIRMVGITGSLAMENANEDSDIDLIIITSKGALWTTRFITYLLLKILGFNLRKPKDKNEKDKLCLNMWMDEGDLAISKRNIYTAHEIVQIIPLKNKDKTYDRFIFENSWVSQYWPNAVRVRKTDRALKKKSLLRFFEPIARSFQFAYMSGKLTSETVNSTRAFFHPFDWGEKVRGELSSSS